METRKPIEITSSLLPPTGLSEEEVFCQQREGFVNTQPRKKVKSTFQIVIETVLTPFNIVNFLIAACLAYVKAWRNTIFLLVVFGNIITRFLQELRSKKLLESLSLISAGSALVIRDGKALEIGIEEVVLHDVLLLDSGRQVCADSVVLQGEVEANESMLTGESEAVFKEEGDSLFSGSSIISGKCYARVVHVGKDNYSAQITTAAQKERQHESELSRGVRHITIAASLSILPIGLLLFLQAAFFRGEPLGSATVSTATALLGILPIGTVLLVGISLAASFIRLSIKEVLVQDMYSLEALAYVDTICMDKTGTLTEGKLRVKNLYMLDETILPVPFLTMLGSYLSVSDDNNSTFQALKEHFSTNAQLPFSKKIPFSSARKWSSVSFGAMGTLFIGAPEVLSKEAVSEKARQEELDGDRVLLIAYSKETPAAYSLPCRLHPVALLSLSDSLRAEARKTISYLEGQNIRVRLLSGDHPRTVSAIARQAGMQEYEDFVDMSTVTTDHGIEEAAAKYAIFGRVSPQQKSKLVESFRRGGHTVAMFGDGVNDLLALREADCGITVADGSEAARQVSQIVLLNSNIAALATLVKEGRRTLNNIIRVAGIFLVKNIYSLLLSILCIFSNRSFPFNATQITLIDWIIEGFPSFIMSVESDNRPISDSFLPYAFRQAFPNGMAIVFSLIMTALFSPFFGIFPGEQVAIGYFLVAWGGILAVYKASAPFSKIHVAVCLFMTVGFYAAVGLFHHFVEIPFLWGTPLLFLFVLMAITFLLERLFSFFASRLLVWGKIH